MGRKVTTGGSNRVQGSRGGEGRGKGIRHGGQGEGGRGSKLTMEGRQEGQWHHNRLGGRRVAHAHRQWRPGGAEAAS